MEFACAGTVVVSLGGSAHNVRGVLGPPGLVILVPEWATLHYGACLSFSGGPRNLTLTNGLDYITLRAHDDAQFCKRQWRTHHCSSHSLFIWLISTIIEFFNYT